jgi:hypothetical protein
MTKTTGYGIAPLIEMLNPLQGFHISVRRTNDERSFLPNSSPHRAPNPTVKNNTADLTFFYGCMMVNVVDFNLFDEKTSLPQFCVEISVNLLAHKEKGSSSGRRMHIDVLAFRRAPPPIVQTLNPSSASGMSTPSGFHRIRGNSREIRGYAGLCRQGFGTFSYRTYQ